MKPPKLPGRWLTVVIRDDSPMIHCGDSPSYRSVRIYLTEEQREQIKLEWIGSSLGHEMYESISKSSIEPEEEQGS